MIVTSRDVCDPNVTSAGWLDPRGVFHEITGSHDMWAAKQISKAGLEQEFANWDGGLSDLPRGWNASPSASQFLMSEGWIRMVNFSSIEMWTANPPRAAAKALAKIWVDCLSSRMDMSPTDVLYLDIAKSRKFETMTFDKAIERWGGRKMLDELYKSLLGQMSSRVAAKYKNKRKVKNQDGKETIIYEYSEKQIQHRNREKAKRVEKLRQSIGDLRAAYKKGLESDDSKERLKALAVALLDQTFERVGNDKSAEESGHFGVTTWQKRHVSVSGNTATFTYTGKSGVKQKKTVSDPLVVKHIKKALEGKKDDDRLLCEGDECRVVASDVNSFLKEFDITAKDVRGMHANEQMKAELKKVRKGDLPKDKKEREKKLKEEFKKALEAAAAAVGHEPSTLKGQYLVPGMEKTFLHDGTIMDKLDKTSALRVAFLFLAKKTRSEKEEEETERLIRKSPKKKPPRRDLERRIVIDEEDEDPDEKQDKKDRSNNYKDAVSRTLARWVQSNKVEKTEKGWKATKGDQTEYFEDKDKAEEWLSKDSGGQEADAEEKEEPEQLFPSEEDLQDESKMSEFRQKIMDSYAERGLVEGEMKGILEQFSDAKNSGDVEAVKELLDEVLEKKTKKVLKNPLVDVEDPLPEADATGDEAEVAAAALERAQKAVGDYRKKTSDERKADWETLSVELENLEDGPRKQHVAALRRAVGVASALEDGGSAEGIGSMTALLARAADKGGNLDALLSLNTIGSAKSGSESDQVTARKLFNDLSDSEWEGVLPDDHPGQDLVELLNDPEKSKHMTEEDKEYVRTMLADLAVADTVFGDPAVTAENPKANVDQHSAAAKKRRKAVTPERQKGESLDDKLDWFKEMLKGIINPDAKGDAVGRQSGDVWRDGDKFWAKNRAGKSQSFEDVESARDWAQGNQR